MKILGIDANYPPHAGGDPVAFLSPSTALCGEGAVRAPWPGHALRCGVGLVARISRTGKRIGFERALEHVGGYAVGLTLAVPGRPRGFDTSAPVSEFRRMEDPQKILLTLKVNGVERQKGSTAEMIVPVAGLVCYLSTVFTLEEGDLIFTGTPAGAGLLKPGDKVEAGAEGIGTLTVTVGEPG